jgi:hypothetical protein
MNYTLPNVNIKHFSKTTPYNGDFSTLFVLFVPNISFNQPIILTKKHQFDTITELQDNEFIQRCVEAFFVNGGDRLYLLFAPIEEFKKFQVKKFENFLIKECDRLKDVEVITAINLFDTDVYKELISPRKILKIQRVITNYCEQSHKVAITDINSSFKKEYLNLLGKTVIYYPWIIDSHNEPVPTSVYASALFSKMAKENLYFESIANKDLLNVRDVEFRLDENELEDLLKDTINPVVFIPHRGVRIWGVKSFDEKLDTINQVRVLKYIKRKLIKMSRVYLFEPNNIFLEAQMILMVKIFLEKMETIGALQSFDVERNEESLIQGNEIIIDIAVAISTPIEFISIRLNKVDKDSIINLG